MRQHIIEKAKANLIQIYYLKYKKKVSTKQHASSLRENRQKKFDERQNNLKKD